MGAIDPAVPLGDRPAVLLFSLPSGVPSILERRLTTFLKTCQTWFGFVDAAEVRSMLRAADTDVRNLDDTDLFGGHLPSAEPVLAGSGVDAVAMGAFGVLKPPPVAHLKAMTRTFALDVCCKWYVSLVEEVVAEAKGARAGGTHAAS